MTPEVSQVGTEWINLLGLLSIEVDCVSTSEAKNTERLYDDLIDYDKRPLVFHPVVHKPPKGRFARSKRSSGHPTVDHMKRYFQSIT